MERDRVGNALARIAAATARIEAASTRARNDGDPDLPRRHAELRASVSASLRELDTLIERIER